MANQDYYVFVGNPGTGKSTILNGFAGDVLFKSGLSFGAGCTSILQAEEVPGKGVFMDTPGLADAKMREQAAAEISKALKKNGNYRIFFVITLEGGRVRPADVTTMRLVMDSLTDIPNVCYSIIINKLEAEAVDMLNTNYENCVDDLMACLMGPETKVKTTNIYYMPATPQLAGKGMDSNNPKKQKLLYELPNDLLKFIMCAPRVYVNSEKVVDVKPDEFDQLRKEMEDTIANLQGNLEEQQRVNDSIKVEMAEQKKIMEATQKEAAEERIKAEKRIKEMEEKHNSDLATFQKNNEREMERMRHDMEKKSGEEKKAVEERMKNMENQNKAKMEEMVKAHEGQLNAAKKNSGGGGLLGEILGAIPVVGPVVGGIAKIFGA